MDLHFSGEYMVPGKSGDRVESDHRARYEFAEGFCNGLEVLDIACGTGYAAPLLMQAGAKTYIGVDVNESVVAYARHHFSGDGIQFVVGDICNFSLSSRPGLITCFETIEHVKEFDRALSNLYSLLSPGGVLLVSSPNRRVCSPAAKRLSGKPANQFHTQEFLPGELCEALQRCGFHVERDSVYGQRVRWHSRVRVLNLLRRLVCGDPNRTSSPRVCLVEAGEPRYFVLVARKPM